MVEWLSHLDIFASKKHLEIMEIANIKEKVTAYILEATFEDKEKVKEDTLIFQEGLLDSMGFVMLLSFIDETFGVKPADEDLVEENFESVNAITNYVMQKHSQLA